MSRDILVLGRPSIRSYRPPKLPSISRKRPSQQENWTKRSLSPTEFHFPATSQAAALTPPLLIPPKVPLKLLLTEDRRGNSIPSSFEFAGLDAAPIRITHLISRRNESLDVRSRLIRPDPRLWRYSQGLQRRKQRYWGCRKRADKALESPKYGLSLPLYSLF